MTGRLAGKTVMPRVMTAGLMIALGLGCDDERTPPRSYPHDDTLSLFHAQLRGTHNSYHIEPDSPVDDSHRYSHASLETQLDQQGVRTLELDIHFIDDELRVFHLAYVDEETWCDPLSDCLTQIASWSENNRHHLPLVIWIEVKTGAIGRENEVHTAIDAAIGTAFAADKLLTPDDVRGDFSSLREALDTNGWPMLEVTRGKVLFVLLNDGPHAELYSSTDDRPMFARATTAQLGETWAAFIKVSASSDMVIADALERRILVASNICSPPMSDDECVAERGAALQNGVSMLFDDFVSPVDSRQYWLDIGETLARCNPITAPEHCTGDALE